MVTLRPQIKTPDYLLLNLVLILTIFGILMVFEASSIVAEQDFGDKFFYVRQQMVWAVLGTMSLFFFSRFRYQTWKKISVFLMVLTLGLLIIVLIPGMGIKALGARRWLSLGGVSLQPAELAKLSFVIYLASLFSQKPKFIPFVITLGVLGGLIMLEPDLGTTIVLISSGFFQYFAAGASLFSLASVGIIGFLGGMILILKSPYRKERFLTFLDLGRDPLGASYHIKQVLLALGSGGLFGLGLGASRQKYAYLPEAMTDSIFAVIAEEFGFFGSLILIGALLLIIFRGLKISQEAPDHFGQLLAVGITSWIGIQALVNLAAMVALVPLTGVPLPFISYGGSSLVINLVGIGILLNISSHKVARK